MVGGYIYVVEGWVAGVEGGEGDAVGCEVIVAWEEGEMNLYIYLSIYLSIYNLYPAQAVQADKAIQMNHIQRRYSH